MNIENIAANCKTEEEYVMFVREWKKIHSEKLEKHLELKQARKGKKTPREQSDADCSYYYSNRNMTRLYELRTMMKKVLKNGGFLQHAA